METIKHVVTDEQMQQITDTSRKLVKLLYASMPKPTGKTKLETNNSLSHSIMGNAVMRVCQAISREVAPVELPVMMNACIQALGQYGVIATEILDDEPVEKPQVH